MAKKHIIHCTTGKLLAGFTFTTELDSDDHRIILQYTPTKEGDAKRMDSILGSITKLMAGHAHVDMAIVGKNIRMGVITPKQDAEQALHEGQLEAIYGALIQKLANSSGVKIEEVSRNSSDDIAFDVLKDTPPPAQGAVANPNGNDLPPPDSATSTEEIIPPVVKIEKKSKGFNGDTSGAAGEIFKKYWRRPRTPGMQ